MGIASKLFFDASDSEKQTLHRRITLSDDQFADQQIAWNDLADHLISDLKLRSGYTVTTWLQGSYKFATQIRPTRIGDEFDIDLGVYFQWQGHSEEGVHAPAVLKDFVQESLLAYAKANMDVVYQVAQPRKRCSRLRYKSAFHIDVPSYHLDPGEDLRCLATDEGWEDSDPKAVYLWFRDAFEEKERAKVRRQVRYLKAWAALHFREGKGRPSSILLTVLAVEASLKLGALGDEDESLAAIVGEVRCRLTTDSNVRNPVNKQENLMRLSSSEISALVEGLIKFHDIATRAVRLSTELSSADLWQEAFQHLFPMPEIEASIIHIVSALPVPHTMPEVSIKAVPRGNAHTQPISGVNAIGPIPRNCDIYFRVTNVSAFPPTAVIVWMVRNEGSEAESINDLGHFAGVGVQVQEHSSYRGTHYMDCAVKVNGITVAMRRVPVQISGAIVPRRNPRARPSYTKLFGKR